MALIYNWESFIRMHGGDEGARAVFEKLMDNLLRAENPGKEVHIIKAVQGDGGIDVGVWQADGLDVYQCKFFMDKMFAFRWTEVKDSFKRVLEFIESDKAKGVKLLNWFLCMPREMRKEDIAKWNEFCEDRKSLGIGLRYIDGNEIIQRLQECDRRNGTNLIDQYFGVTKNISKCLTSIPAVNRTVGLVGRDDIKKTILAMLEEPGRMVLLSGLGGIGKTAVMEWVCNELKEEGRYVAWIDCGSSLRKDLLVLGEALGISEKDSDVAYKMILKVVKTRLDGSLYLFMDNLFRQLSKDELRDLNSLNAHVMVTSRQRNSAFLTVDLDVLEPEAALTMFFKYYNEDRDRQSETAARMIVSSAHRHTLLVELLAKAARKAGGTLERFSEKLEKEGVYDVFKRGLETSHDENENLTIEECVMKLYEFSNLSEEQRRIMKLFIIFTPEREIYWEVAEWAGLDMDEVDELVDLAWLERSGPESNYKIHQIIKDSMTRQMKNSGEVVQLEDYGELLDKAADTDSYMPQDLEYTKVRERLGTAEDIAENLADRTDGMLEVEEIAEDKKDFLSDSADLFHNMADVFRLQGEYKRALKYYEKAKLIRERVLGFEDSDTAATYNNMAIVLQSQCNYERALEYLQTARSIRERVLGTDHPDTATTYNYIANVFRLQGNYKAALEYHNKALAIREKVLVPNHQDTAATYNNMGVVYWYLGDYKRALEYYEKARVIREQVLGFNHPDTATTYNNIAGVYDKQGDYENAFKYYEKALAIRKRVLGTYHPYTATTYNHMALVYLHKGVYGLALEYNEKALVIRKNVYDSNHLSIGTSYNNMAGVYKAQGIYEKALELYGKALLIREHALGTDHPDTGTTYYDMAGVYEAQGDYEKALAYYEKALAIRRLKLGENHQDTKDAQLSVDEMKQLLKREGEAE